jgi:D-arabinose 1-dehydrogenase-like Zn-dependent alcohol dehydrogenase
MLSIVATTVGSSYEYKQKMSAVKDNGRYAWVGIAVSKFSGNNLFRNSIYRHRLVPKIVYWLPLSNWKLHEYFRMALLIYKQHKRKPFYYHT